MLSYIYITIMLSYTYITIKFILYSYYIIKEEQRGQTAFTNTADEANQRHLTAREICTEGIPAKSLSQEVLTGERHRSEQ